MKKYVSLLILVLLSAGCGRTFDSPATHGNGGEDQRPIRSLSNGTYLGCFTDAESRALPHLLSQDMTNDECIAAAAANGYAYAGSQYGGECYGGSSLGYTQVNDGECNMPCNRDSNQICGAGWRNSVFATHTTATPPPEGPGIPEQFRGQYEGCFTDDYVRALPVYLEYNVSIAACISIAKSSGYTYAGLQYGGQCFAGNSLGYSKVSDSECNMGCNSNSREACGAAWRNSIYRSGFDAGHVPNTMNICIKAGDYPNYIAGVHLQIEGPLSGWARTLPGGCTGFGVAPNGEYRVTASLNGKSKVFTFVHTRPRQTFTYDAITEVVTDLLDPI